MRDRSWNFDIFADLRTDFKHGPKQADPPVATTVQSNGLEARLDSETIPNPVFDSNLKT
jgi:hypothetical protein